MVQIFGDTQSWLRMASRIWSSSRIPGQSPAIRKLPSGYIRIDHHSPVKPYHMSPCGITIRCGFATLSGEPSFVKCTCTT